MIWILVLGIALTAVPLLGFFIFGGFMMRGTLNDDDDGDKVFTGLIASVAIGAVMMLMGVLSILKDEPQWLLLILGSIFALVPLIGFITIGCWMLYKELKNEDEWGKLFTSMVVSVSFGIILLLLYFIFTSRAA